MKTPKIIYLALAMVCAACNHPAPEPDNLSQTGWAAGYDKKAGYGILSKTTDGGKTWTYQTSPTDFPNTSFSCLLALNDQLCWVMGTYTNPEKPDDFTGYLYKTTDGGKTWIKQNPGFVFEGPSYGIASHDGIHLWIAGLDYIYYSNNAGESWTKTKIVAPIDAQFDNFEVENISTYDGTNIYVGGAARTTDSNGNLAYKTAVYYSNDQGETWNMVLIGTDRIIIDLSTPAPQTVYMVGQRWFAAKTTNNFQSVELLKNVAVGRNDNNGVFALDDQRVVVGIDYDVIYYSENGGATWSTATNNSKQKGCAVMRLVMLQDAEYTGRPFRTRYRA